MLLPASGYQLPAKPKATAHADERGLFGKLRVAFSLVYFPTENLRESA